MTEPRPISTLLIANRGEIALRIIGTARRMGLRTAVVYSEADAASPALKAADVAVPVGPAEAARSYLDQEKILAAVRETGAEAVHPGYGFLSENADFAARCEGAGVTFIGPPARAIAAMGSKSAAKALMAEAGVPLVPGYHGDDQSPETFLAQADHIGFPLLIKASAGGGGKGMRVVRQPRELAAEVAAARREARSAFGNDHLLLERYLEQPRHVEVQLLFDNHGNGRYLSDRDCSVQRRHQKIIEEAPAPGIPGSVRHAMGQAAVRCGEAIGYRGAGTVEFLYLPDSQEFFFMEMNTRLQVEHPVTEAITGLDLVEWQLRVAMGEILPWQQAELQWQGHAIEARVYAEDPAAGFLPQTGRLQFLREPAPSARVRVDSGVTEGQEVTPWYDPMLAKVIGVGESRDQARRQLMAALDEYHADGVTLNVGFVTRVLAHPDFAAARLTTGFLDAHRDALAAAPLELAEQAALSWLAWLQQGGYLAGAGVDSAGETDPWRSIGAFRLGDPDWQACELDLGGARHSGRYQLLGTEARFWLEGQGEPMGVRWQTEGGQVLRVRLGGKSVRLESRSHGDEVVVFAGADTWRARVNHPEVRQVSERAETELTAPMHGRVTAVLCQPGEDIAAGAPLLTLEAMKMEHTLKSAFAGRVGALHCAVGDSVVARQLLVELEPQAVAHD